MGNKKPYLGQRNLQTGGLRLPAGVSLVGSGPDGQVTFAIDAWSQPPPEIEYSADASDISVEGAPTLYFAQVGPARAALNCVAIRVPLPRLRELLRSFGAPPFSERLRNIARDPEFTPPAMPELGSLNSGNFRKFESMVIRGGLNDDIAMLDFYRAAALAPENISKNPQDFLRSCIRVLLTPKAFAMLMSRIEETISTFKDRE